MPLYEYQCEACGHRFEKIQKFSDPPVEVCPNCGQRQVHKLLSSPAIQFKGTGWYITDYAKKTSAGSESSKSTDSKSSSGAKDAGSGSAESKSSDTGATGTAAKASDSKPAKAGD